MSGFFYPTLDLQTLQALEVVRELIDNHPDYFKDCPYPTQTEKLLRKWFIRPEPTSPDYSPEGIAALTKRGRGRPPKASTLFPPPLEQFPETFGAPEEPKPEENEAPMFEGLRAEIIEAYRHLKSAKNVKGQDRVDYARSAVNLLEKLVKMESAVVNVELVGNFQRTVMEILEEVCTQEQRAQVMAKLKGYLAPDMQGIADSISATEEKES